MVETVILSRLGGATCTIGSVGVAATDTGRLPHKHAPTVAAIKQTEPTTPSPSSLAKHPVVSVNRPVPTRRVKASSRCSASHIPCIRRLSVRPSVKKLKCPGHPYVLLAKMISSNGIHALWFSLLGAILGPVLKLSGWVPHDLYTRRVLEVLNPSYTLFETCYMSAAIFFMFAIYINWTILYTRIMRY